MVVDTADLDFLAARIEYLSLLREVAGSHCIRSRRHHKERRECLKCPINNTLHHRSNGDSPGLPVVSIQLREFAPLRTSTLARAELPGLECCLVNYRCGSQVRLVTTNLAHCLCANAHEKGISNLRAPLTVFSSCDLSLHGDIGGPSRTRRGPAHAGAGPSTGLLPAVSTQGRARHVSRPGTSAQSWLAPLQSDECRRTNPRLSTPR